MGWDAGFLLYIQEYIRSDFLNPIMKVLTHSGDKGILLIVLILAFLIIPRTRAIGIMSTISIAIEALLNNVLLKNLIDSNGIIDEAVLDKLKLNCRAILESLPEVDRDLMDLCLDVIYHKNMKALGLTNLVQLYVTWEEKKAANEEV